MRRRHRNVTEGNTSYAKRTSRRQALHGTKSCFVSTKSNALPYDRINLLFIKFAREVDKRPPLRETIYIYQNLWDDGLYYFGLDDEEYKLVQKYKYTKLKTPFRNIRLYKIKEECFLKKSKTHFFKVYRPFDMGFCVLEEKLNTNNYKEIAYRDSNGKIVLINE